MMRAMSSPPYNSESPSGANLSELDLRCPPLPATLREALDLTDDPEQMDMDRVTEMAERDPGVVVRLLRTVNSAYYGVGRSISSVRRAVVMLGPLAVTGIVIGMNMLKLRSVLNGPAEEGFTRLIRHSAATGFLARHMTKHLPRYSVDRSGDPFTAGLLHDFGKLILVYNRAEEAAAFYDKHALKGHVQDEDICHLEQLLFGYDHTEAGEFAARKLDFPEPLVDVMRHHHTPKQAAEIGTSAPLVRIVAAANLAAKAMGFAFTQSVDWEGCRETPSWTYFVEHELPPNRADELVADLKDQEDALDDYVDQMSFTTR